MNDAELKSHLEYMGIDDQSFRVVALLPLVQVAWADGAVQDGERKLIVDLAQRHFQLDAGASQLLDGWLTFRPTDAYLSKGREVLVELARRSSGPHVTPTTLQEVIDFSLEVARAAGGLFGIGAVDAQEKTALEEIASALTVQSVADWNALVDELEADEDVYNWMTHGALKPTPIRGNDAYNRRLQELLEDSPQAEVVSLRHLQWSRVFTDGAEPPRDYHSMTNDEVIASLRAVVKGSDMSDPLTILMDVVADRLEAKNG